MEVGEGAGRGAVPVRCRAFVRRDTLASGPPPPDTELRDTELSLSGEERQAHISREGTFPARDTSYDVSVEETSHGRTAAPAPIRRGNVPRRRGMPAPRTLPPSPETTLSLLPTVTAFGQA